MQPIDLNLTLDEINTVLEALGQLPYVRVFQLVTKIQQQTAPQLQDFANNANGGPEQTESN